MSLNAWRMVELVRERREELRLDQARSETKQLLAACETEITLLDDPAVQQLAAQGIQQVRGELRAASEQVAANPEKALKAARTAQKKLHQVIANAQAQAHRWSQEKAASKARLDEVRTRAKAAKTLGNRAAEEILAQVDALLRQATTLCCQGRYLEVMSGCEEADALIAKAQKAALDETVRREVVSSLITTLQDNGFVIEGPRIQKNEAEGGIVTLVGKLPSGKLARFEVHLDGRMHYDLDGYEGRACAAEVQRIEQTLHDRFRVKLGPPQTVWKDQNPDKISKGARNLPSGSTNRQAG